MDGDPGYEVGDGRWAWIISGTGVTLKTTYIQIEHYLVKEHLLRRE